MRIEEQTYNLNFKILGTNDTDAKIQIEELAPMSKDELWAFLVRSAKAQELPKSARPSTAVWRDTRESPQPKSKLKEMDEFNAMYKKLKRKFPTAKPELLMQKTKDYIEARKKILEELGGFQDTFQEMLGKGQSDILKVANCKEPSQGAQAPTTSNQTFLENLFK